MCVQNVIRRKWLLIRRRLNGDSLEVFSLPHAPTSPINSHSFSLSQLYKCNHILVHITKRRLFYTYNLTDPHIHIHLLLSVPPFFRRRKEGKGSIAQYGNCPKKNQRIHCSVYLIIIISIRVDRGTISASQPPLHHPHHHHHGRVLLYKFLFSK